MRTVADAGTMATLVTAQTAVTRTPYHYMLFTDKGGGTTVNLSTNSAAFPNRILSIDHREEAWTDSAYIVLNDPARDVPDLRGYWTEIGYGLTIAGSIHYSKTPRLWVKHQQTVWARDRYTSILELEGGMARLNEITVCNTTANTAGEFEPSSDVYSMSGSTVYQMLGTLLPGYGFSLAASSVAEDDGIHNANTLNFLINSSPDETAGQIIRGMMTLTYNYLLPQTGMVMKEVYTAATTVDYTYNKDTQPKYYDFVERENTALVNKAYIFAGRNDVTGNYTIVASTTDTAGTVQYLLTPIYGRAPSVASSGQAVQRAQMYLTKLQAQETAGRVMVAHDAQIELYDRIKVIS